MLTFRDMRARSIISGLDIPFVVVTGFLFLAVCWACASDETGQPAPRFHARTTARDQFGN